MNYYRHGDLVIKPIDKLLKNLKQTKTKTLMTGSGGNHHTIDRGKVYFQNVNQFVFGYLVAKNTSLYHKDHGEKKEKIKVAKIEDGIYEMRKQQEIRHSGMMPVSD